MALRLAFTQPVESSYWLPWQSERKFGDGVMLAGGSSGGRMPRLAGAGARGVVVVVVGAGGGGGTVVVGAGGGVVVVVVGAGGKVVVV
ncbi:MAG TPA: hypothetical protein VEJ21_04555, partial [Acidimicrobiales bacterium]|nr:hypothetical protein [Acidimicrobiales bacterium]